MSKSVLAAILALFLALPAFAQVVRVTKTDGKVVQGELLGFENGRYRVRLANGTVEDIDEKKVQDIVLVSPSGERGLSRDAASLEAARAAFERNDLELALQKISEAMRSLDDDRTQVGELTARISAAYLERLLEQKDAARFTEGLRQVVPTLTPATRKDLLQKMADRLGDLHRTAPDNAFTAAWARRSPGWSTKERCPRSRGTRSPSCSFSGPRSRRTARSSDRPSRSSAAPSGSTPSGATP